METKAEGDNKEEEIVRADSSAMWAALDERLQKQETAAANFVTKESLHGHLEEILKGGKEHERGTDRQGERWWSFIPYFFGGK